MTAGAVLAALVARYPRDAHDSDRLQRARLHLVDTLGVALAARDAPIALVSRSVAPEIGGDGGCRVIGAPDRRVGPAAAAFANGVAAHCLEYDDTHLAAVIHPSAVVVPAALAVSEATGASVGQLLDAMVLGWEVVCRLGLALGAQLDARGFHVTGVLGPFGAAAASARLMGLDADALESAFGLCCSQGAGTNQAMLDGSWNKAFHAGWASHGGVVASYLARRGFRGSRRGVDGEQGLVASLLPGLTDELDRALDRLGDEWACEDIALKKYGCCHLIHACLDGVGGILADSGTVSPCDVEEIVCRIPEAGIKLVGGIVPLGGPVQAARFSLPVCVALRLDGHAVAPQDFVPERVESESVRRLAARVRVEATQLPGYPAVYPGEIVVKLRDGRRLAAAITDVEGSNGRPISLDALVGKFCRNVESAVPGVDSRHLCATLLEIDLGSPAAQLMETLGTALGGGPSRGADESPRCVNEAR